MIAIDCETLTEALRDILAWNVFGYIEDIGREMLLKICLVITEISP